MTKQSFGHQITQNHILRLERFSCQFLFNLMKYEFVNFDASNKVVPGLHQSYYATSVMILLSKAGWYLSILVQP